MERYMDTRCQYLIIIIARARHIGWLGCMSPRFLGPASQQLNLIFRDLYRHVKRQLILARAKYLIKLTIKTTVKPCNNGFEGTSIVVPYCHNLLSPI